VFILYLHNWEGFIVAGEFFIHTESLENEWKPSVIVFGELELTLVCSFLFKPLGSWPPPSHMCDPEYPQACLGAQHKDRGVSQGLELSLGKKFLT
jgi:hypothetical protein